MDDVGGAFTEEVRQSGATVEGIYSGIGPVGLVSRLVYRTLALPALALTRSLRKDRPLVLQCFHDECNLIGALAGRLAGVPVVALGVRSLHPRDPAWSDKAHWATAYDALDPRSVDAVIVNSEAGRSALSVHEPRLSPAKVHVVRNCVVPPVGSATALRRPLSPPVILWLARVAPEKRPDVFVALLPTLRRERVSFEAWIAGDGPSMSSMKRLVEDAGLSGAVRFLGVVHEVGRLLDGASVLVLCSDVEGAPNAILEAQYSGCPVVATAVGGVTELVVAGVSGFLVPAGDVDSLAARVSEVLLDREAAMRLASAGRASVLHHFSADRMVEATLDVYRRVEVERCSTRGAATGRA